MGKQAPKETRVERLKLQLGWLLACLPEFVIAKEVISCTRLSERAARLAPSSLELMQAMYVFSIDS